MSRGFRRGKYKRRDAQEIAGVVYHSTGPGPWRRHIKDPKKHPTPLDAAIFIYEHLTDAGPHFVIDQKGAALSLCSPLYAAWHVGKGRWVKGTSAAQYWSKRQAWAKNPKYDWWFQRFTTLSSPTELMGGKLWRNGSANQNTIGIEIVPHSDTRQPFTLECLRTLHRICKGLSEDYGFPFDPKHIISHCEAHPITRTGKFGPYDTFESNLVRHGLFSL